MTTGTVRSLGPDDTAEALRLVRPRPLHNLFLDYAISAGALGRIPGFFGYFVGSRMEGIVLIGPMGGTVLEVRNADAYAPLAVAAAMAPLRPRHLVGAVDVMEPFWAAYRPYAAPLRWDRREPVYVLDRAHFGRSGSRPGEVRIEPAREADLDEIVVNSAAQHIEDLKDDRCAADRAGFVARHRRDIRERRWWVVREGGRIAFQMHVGAENEHVIQIGGVMTPHDLRHRGHARRGLSTMLDKLLEYRPMVTLFCDEGNLPARRLYEQLGFEVLYWNHSWLLEEPVLPHPEETHA